MCRALFYNMVGHEGAIANAKVFAGFLADNLRLMESLPKSSALGVDMREEGFCFHLPGILLCKLFELLFGVKFCKRRRTAKLVDGVIYLLVFFFKTRSIRCGVFFLQLP